MLTTLRAAFSLALLVGFYLYVLGIVVGLLTLSGWLISRGEVNQFTIALAVISLVLAGSVLVETWRAARAKPEIPGLPLPENRAPELWATVRQLADAVGTRPPDEIRLVPEGLEEEGYAVTACKSCGGYLKELDRRVRWNGGRALVEDWGSPHLDLVARREGYWRPVPVLVALAD